jgi:hypothetical protein
MEMQSGNARTPQLIWRSTLQHHVQHEQQQTPKRSRQGHHALWVDGKLLMELLGGSHTINQIELFLPPIGSDVQNISAVYARESTVSHGAEEIVGKRSQQAIRQDKSINCPGTRHESKLVFFKNGVTLILDELKEDVILFWISLPRCICSRDG